MDTQFKQYVKLLWKFLEPQKLRVFLLTLILGSSVALQLVNPQILRYFIDAATYGKSARMLTIAALIFIGAALIQQVLAIIATYVSQNVGWTATNALRVELVEHCINLDMSFHKSHQPSEIIERVDGDVTALFNFFSKFMINVLTNGVLVIGILILLFREDFRVGISLSIFAFAAMYTLWKIQASSVDKWVMERETSAKFYGFIGEEIGNTEDVRSSGAEEYVMYKFYKYIRNWLPITKKAVFRYYLMWASTLGIFAIGNIIAFGASGYLWSKGLITIGTVYLIFNYTESLRKPIQEIRTQLEDLQKAGASVVRVQELLNMKSKIVDGTEKLISTGAISVEAKNISFEYEEGVPVLKDISFSLPKGKVLGILGRTGSGKSTLARMLARLYDPNAGDIYFEGKKLNSVSLKELRRNTAFVTQDVQLFHATVRDNLTFFNPNIKDEEILATLHDIGLQEWHNSLPNGLETMLEAGGGGLSAGEAQLLAFVRVFLKNPGLVILDEASSKLDPITEQLIERALNKLLENRTCIIIAHRLWTVQRADDILILENGNVIEYGNREKLLRDKESKFLNLLQKGMEDVEESIIA